MNRKFIQYKTHFAVIYWLILANLHGIINGYSVLADIQRRELVFASWEPFVWEISSQIAMLMLIPLLLYLDNKRPLSFNRIKSGMVYHLTISVVFSLLHVSLMVALRELSYCVNGSDYPVSSSHFRSLETPEHPVSRPLLDKKNHQHPR